MHLSTCRICGHEVEESLLVIRVPDRFERYLGIPEHGYERRWAGCTYCGAANNVHDPRHLERLAALGTAYSEVDFASSTILEKYQKVMALPSERSDNAQRVLRILDFIDRWRARHGGADVRPATVLDIGAGTGVFLSRFLAEAERRGEKWIGVAIEPDPIACRHLKALEEFRVIEGLFTGQPDLVQFDLCTFNKVLEHVPGPLGLLQQARDAIRPGSMSFVYAEVPDRLSINCRPPSDASLGALHYHLYSPHTLGVLFERAGMVPLQLSRILDPSGKLTVCGFAMTVEGYQLAIRRDVKGGGSTSLSQ